MNNVIDDLACTIGVNRGALNVVCARMSGIARLIADIRSSQEAAGKGLVAGNFRLIRESQVILNAQSATEVSRTHFRQDRS